MLSRFFLRPRVLDGNRWTPADNEMAVFFRFKDLSGLLTKILHIPAGMKGWVLRGDTGSAVELLNEGEHTVETLFQRMNNFFRSSPGEVLIVRTDAMPLHFEFDAVMSAENLPLKVQLDLYVRVRTGANERNPDVAAFRRKFMLRDGVVTTAGLQDLLQQPLRQMLGEFLAAWRAPEMAGNAEFRTRLEASLHNRLEPFLGDLGLELVALSGVQACHEKLDELRQLKGRLWLVRAEQAAHDEHAKAFGDLYDAKEQEQLRQREQALQRKTREADISGGESELAQRLRLREIEELSRVLAADTDQEATRMGAADAVEALRSEFSARRQQREQKALGESYTAEGEKAEWLYLQKVARIRYDARLRHEDARLEQMIALQRETARAEMAIQAAHADIDLARLLSDEEARRSHLAAAVGAEIKAKARIEQIEEVKAEAAVDDIKLGAEIKRQESRRLQALEDAQVKQKVESIELSIQAAQTGQKLQTLGALINLDHQDEQNKQAREDDRLDKELDRRVRDRQQAHEHALAKGEQGLQKLGLTMGMPLQALLLLADNPEQIDALLAVATQEAHKEMTPEAITASLRSAAPVAVAPPFNHFPPAQAAGPSLADQVRLNQADDRHWLGGAMDRQSLQQTEFLGALTNAVNALRDVGVANAKSPSAIAPPVAAAPAAVFQAAVAAPPSSGPAVLSQAYVQCAAPSCRGLNPAGARFCTQCGEPMR